MEQKSFLWESHGTKLIVMGFPWDKAYSLENENTKKIANILLGISVFNGVLPIAYIPL